MDVYVWMKSIEEWELKAGISGEREKELLENGINKFRGALLNIVDCT